MRLQVYITAIFFDIGRDWLEHLIIICMQGEEYLRRRSHGHTAIVSLSFELKRAGHLVQFFSSPNITEGHDGSPLVLGLRSLAGHDRSC